MRDPDKIHNAIAEALRNFAASDEWFTRAVHLNMALNHALSLGADLPRELHEQLMAERQLLASKPL